MFSFLFENIFTCTCALVHFALCIHEIHRHRHVDGFGMSIYGNSNSDSNGMVWHGMAWYWIAIFLCPLCDVSLNLLNKKTLDHGCTGTHIFSSLASTLSPLFFFFLLTNYFIIWLIQCRKRICVFLHWSRRKNTLTHILSSNNLKFALFFFIFKRKENSKEKTTEKDDLSTFDHCNMVE